MDRDLDPYLLLGVPLDADSRMIKRAFRSLARRLHPDLSPEPADHARFRAVREAYDLLMDPHRRGAYDRRRAAREGAGTTFEPLRARARERELEDMGDAVLDAILRAFFGGGGPLAADRARLFEGRVSGSRRVEVDAFLSRDEARAGITIPFRFHLGPRLLRADLPLPPGLRSGSRLRFEVPAGAGVALEVIVHVEIGD
jgi:molecular chaperone DnaJ